ncbi:MAG: YtxH domain-containing protein [Sphingobacteriales bacterium]|nr:MAG: YtxH domain-containing protein [Sphingobacteriales bacterium]
MNNQSRLFLAFLAGALAGVAITYMVSTEKGEEVVDDFRSMANKLKGDLADRVKKARGANVPDASAMGDNPEQYTGI